MLDGTSATNTRVLERYSKASNRSASTLLHERNSTLSDMFKVIEADQAEKAVFNEQKAILENIDFDDSVSGFLNRIDNWSNAFENAESFGKFLDDTQNYKSRSFATATASRKPMNALNEYKRVFGEDQERYWAHLSEEKLQRINLGKQETDIYLRTYLENTDELVKHLAFGKRLKIFEWSSLGDSGKQMLEELTSRGKELEEVYGIVVRDMREFDDHIYFTLNPELSKLKYQDTVS